MKIDLAIITDKPDASFLDMIEKVSEQTVSINKIIVINVEQKYFDRIVYNGSKFLDEHKNLEVHHISRREYDCGKTRNAAVKYSDADYIIFMAQNAVPSDTMLFERLIAKLESDKGIAVAYARQIAKTDSTEDYKVFKSFLYPQDSAVRDERDVKTLGWAAYFSSNACAAYRRRLFDELEGFGNHVIAGEDILYAAKAMHSGYKVAYVSEALVVYSVEWTKEAMERFTFDTAVSHAKHPEIFDTAEIRTMLKKEGKLAISHMKRNGFVKESVGATRRMRRIQRSYKLGLKYKHMGKAALLKYTGNPEYWRMDELMRDRSAINAHLGYGRSEEEVAMLKQIPIAHKDED